MGVGSSQADPFPSLSLFLVWKRRRCLDDLSDYPGEMVSPKPGAQEVLSACVIIVITSQQGRG